MKFPLLLEAWIRFKKWKYAGCRILVISDQNLLLQKQKKINQKTHGDFEMPGSLNQTRHAR